MDAEDGIGWLLDVMNTKMRESRDADEEAERRMRIELATKGHCSYRYVGDLIGIEVLTE